MSKFAKKLVFTAPSFPLATKRVAQNGIAPDKRAKYVAKSKILAHKPYCSVVMNLVISKVKIIPVEILNNLATKIIKPEY